MKIFFRRFIFITALFVMQGIAFASEADLKIPDLHEGRFNLFGGLTGYQILLYGAMVILGTVGLSLYQFAAIKKLPAHKSMIEVEETIYQTCKTYLKQQVKFLLMLFGIIALAMSYYFVGLQHETLKTL